MAESKRLKRTTSVLVINVIVYDVISKEAVVQAFPQYASAKFVDVATLPDANERLVAEKPDNLNYHRIVRSVRALVASLPTSDEIVVAGKITLPAAFLLGRLLTHSTNVVCIQSDRVDTGMVEMSLVHRESDDNNKLLEYSTPTKSQLCGVVAVAISSGGGSQVGVILNGNFI